MTRAYSQRVVVTPVAETLEPFVEGLILVEGCTR